MPAKRKSYAEKLLDPRWQKLRLFIMERDHFTCQMCQSTEKTLHVHHGYYGRGMEPWEYDESLLTTLCVDCHPIVQADIEVIHSLIAAIQVEDLENLSDFLKTLLRAQRCGTPISCGNWLEELVPYLDGRWKEERDKFVAFLESRETAKT